MPDADDRPDATGTLVSPGGADLLIAAAVTGTPALILAALGGTMLGGAIVRPFVARDEEVAPEPICPPPADATEATASAADNPSPEGRWTARATARAAVTARRR